jgi:hypothetical protein
MTGAGQNGGRYKQAMLEFTKKKKLQNHKQAQSVHESPHGLIMPHTAPRGPAGSR